MQAKKLFLYIYCFVQAKRIDREMKKVNWESEYGVTCDKMEEIKERIYKNLEGRIKNYEKEKRIKKRI